MQMEMRDEVLSLQLILGDCGSRQRAVATHVQYAPPEFWTVLARRRKLFHVGDDARSGGDAKTVRNMPTHRCVRVECLRYQPDIAVRDAIDVLLDGTPDGVDLSWIFRHTPSSSWGASSSRYFAEANGAWSVFCVQLLRQLLRLGGIGSRTAAQRGGTLELTKCLHQCVLGEAQVRSPETLGKLTVVPLYCITYLALPNDDFAAQGLVVQGNCPDKVQMALKLCD